MIWIHPVEGKILNILYCNMQIFKIALPQNVISQCMMIDKKVNKIILYSNNILYTLLVLLYLLLVYCIGITSTDSGMRTRSASSNTSRRSTGRISTLYKN